MAITFNAFEDEVNAAVIDSLANQTLSINGLNVDGIFVNDYNEVGFVESSNPAFFAKEQDLQIVEHGMDAYMSDGTKYKIVGKRPDGTGITVLELHVEWRT